MQIEILLLAENDILNAITFYDKQSSGIGSYFLDTIMADIESLHIYAGIHMQIWGYHRLLSKRFPFSVYYKTEDNAVYIYAVLDNRREPLFTKERLITTGSQI